MNEAMVQSERPRPPSASAGTGCVKRRPRADEGAGEVSRQRTGAVEPTGGGAVEIDGFEIEAVFGERIRC